MFCRHCGRELYEGAFFCTNCGTPINQMDLPAREAVFPPAAGAGAQGASGTGTVESIHKMQPATAVQAAELPEREVIADISVEPKVEIHKGESMPGQSAAQESSAAASEASEQPESAETPEAQPSILIQESGTEAASQSETSVQLEATGVPAQSSMSVQESVTEAASQSETSVQLGSAEIPAQLSAPVKDSVTEAAGQQEISEQPDSTEVTAVAVSVTPQQEDAVSHRAASAAAPESSQPQKYKERSKVAFTIVIVVAAVLFLVGVWGAIYFSGSEDELLYSQGDLPAETKKPEWSGLVEPEETENPEDTTAPKETEKPEEPEETEAPKESEKPGETMEPEASAEPEETEDPEWVNPWFEEQEGSDFSGRDVYPDMYGYGEGVAGDTMHTYWFDYTVTRAYVCNEFEGYAPSSGNELLLVEIVIKNTFNRSIPMFDTDFQIQWNDDAPDAYEWPVSNSEYLSDIILPEEYTLNVEERIKGYLLYEVPAGYSDFSLSYQEIFADDSTGDLFFLYFTADRVGGSISL